MEKYSDKLGVRGRNGTKINQTCFRRNLLGWWGTIIMLG